MDKQELRKIMLQKRREVTAREHNAASMAVVKKLLEFLNEYLAGRNKADNVVLSYLAYGREIDLTRLHEQLWQQGVSLSLPKTEGFLPGEMAAVEYTPKGELKKTGLGVREPVGAAEIDPEKIAVVIVPGVAFDALGNRLGHGMGYYDRFLPKTRALAVGVGYAWQLVSAVPVSEFDRRMDKIITD